MNIIIGADVVPTQSNMHLFCNGVVNKLLGEELLSLWNAADIRIFNLEVPLCDNQDPIVKCGSNLIAPTSTVNGIKALNPTLLSLANNHILDQGTQGLKSVKDTLNKNKIPFVGIGDNSDEASKPYIIKKDGLKIGVYACAQHEFSIASENTPGANPFDELESFDHVQNLKAECDYVIVLYHGGIEYYRYPSPDLQKICRKLAEKGADLIICQHSHCIGAFENYNGSTIVYGQGNFLFDISEGEFSKTSLLIKVIVNDQGMSVDYIPIFKHGNIVRLADKQYSEEILQAFKERSQMILDDDYIRKEYEKFASQMWNNYLEAFHGKNIFFRVVNRLCGRRLVAKLYSDKSLKVLQNIIECEAHRELVLRALKNIHK